MKIDKNSFPIGTQKFIKKFCLLFQNNQQSLVAIKEVRLDTKMRIR